MTRVIWFRLDGNSSYADEIYYFTTIVKERNSYANSIPYYCTVNITGNKTDTKKFSETIPVDWAINWMHYTSKGSILFTYPVNSQWLEKNFFLMFRIYWQDTRYNIPKEDPLFDPCTDRINHTVQEFAVTSDSKDN